MKAVLLSIQPKWCDLIASGRKTVEVRKTAPKLKPPFTCYMYHTKIRNADGCDWNNWSDCWQLPNGEFVNAGGKVVGKFVCDKIEKFTVGSLGCDEMQVKACLRYGEIIDYFYKKDGSEDLKVKFGYAWHISDLQIFDEPMKLGDFYNYNQELQKRFDEEVDYCCYDATDEYGEALTECNGDNIRSCYRCWEEWSGWCKQVKRPPQSWQYVET